MESLAPGDGDAVRPLSEEPSADEVPPAVDGAAAAAGELPANEAPAPDAGGASWVAASAAANPAANAGAGRARMPSPPPSLPAPPTDGPGDGAVAAAGPDAGAVTSAHLKDAIDQLLKETDLQSVCVGKFRRRLLGTE